VLAAVNSAKYLGIIFIGPLGVVAVVALILMMVSGKK
jgi:hypothetical protein